MFGLLFTVSTFTLVLKDNKLLRSHNIVEIRVFFKFLLADGRIITDPGESKTYGPTDPEH